VKHCEVRGKEEPVDSYIVRVYRTKKSDPHVLVGTVEKVGTRGRAAFTTMDELWEIVDEGAESRSEGERRAGESNASQRAKV
jgi:hypothetical protein